MRELAPMGFFPERRRADMRIAGADNAKLERIVSGAVLQLHSASESALRNKITLAGGSARLLPPMKIIILLETCPIHHSGARLWMGFRCALELRDLDKRFIAHAGRGIVS